MVEESYGACIKCGKEDILGDGLCERCWDVREDGVQTQRNTSEELLIDQLLGPRKIVGKIVGKTGALKKDTEELQQAINKVLSFLTERQQRIVTLRFGLEDKGRSTLAQVGLEFNLSRERIRQIQAKALRRLYWQCHRGKSKQLKAFLTEEPTTVGEILLRSIFSTRKR